MKWPDPFISKKRRLAWLRQEASKLELPEEIYAYLEQATTLPDKKSSWQPLRFVVLDTETTGLDQKTDHVLSVCAITVCEQKILLGETFEAIIRPDQHTISTDQIHIHRIMPSESREGTHGMQVVSEFLDFIGSDILVGHHLGFDIRMLEQLIGKYLPGFFLYNHKVDTARLASKLDHPHRPVSHIQTRQYSLDHLIKRFDLTDRDRHTAHGDSLMTAELLLRLLYVAKKRGRNRLKDIL